MKILTDYLARYKREYSNGEYRDCGLVYVGYVWREKDRYNIYHYDCNNIDDVWRKMWRHFHRVKYVLMEVDSVMLRGLNCVIVCDEKKEELCVRRVYKELAEKVLLDKGEVDEDAREALEIAAKRKEVIGYWDTVVFGMNEMSLAFFRVGSEVDGVGVLLYSRGSIPYWKLNLEKMLDDVLVCEVVYGDLDEYWAKVLLGGD